MQGCVRGDHLHQHRHQGVSVAPLSPCVLSVCDRSVRAASPRAHRARLPRRGLTGASRRRRKPLVYPTPEGSERSAYKGKNITCQPMKSGKVPREAYMDGSYPWVSDVRTPPPRPTVALRVASCVAAYAACGGDVLSSRARCVARRATNTSTEPCTSTRKRRRRRDLGLATFAGRTSSRTPFARGSTGTSLM